MEITLEKIELVKDRTGVSYKEAKEALEAAEGNVVDAIISIEDSIDIKSKSKITEQSAQVVEKLKDLVKRGNISKICIKKNGEVILNLSVNIGIIGTVIAPWAAIAGTIAALGTKCQIEVIKDNGEVIDVTEMAYDAFDDAKEKGSALADEMKVKGEEVYHNVKDKATEAIHKATKKEEVEEDKAEEDTVEEVKEDIKK
jgi:NACalpha-BTF3-like transcription factor